MEKKNFVCIRLTKSSQMTVKDTIGRMCHDIRATRPGYLRDDPEAKCYWFPEKEKGQGVRPTHLTGTVKRSGANVNLVRSRFIPSLFAKRVFLEPPDPQYREPLTRGGQSQRRGGESHRIKHKGEHNGVRPTQLTFVVELCLLTQK